ncbi:MAG: AAA family ATPase [Campylobacteraceae bacterium]|jgi:ABC-type cobalamin/Fe3+-siderophores transport system ATPase subunit|nr:AAA family ATPase [Campylobacteraceae bacterium]
MNEQFIQVIETLLKQLQLHKSIATKYNVNEETLQLYDKFIVYCSELKEVVENNKLVVNYMQLFQNDINSVLSQLSHLIQRRDVLNKEQIKSNVEKLQPQLQDRLQSMQFNLDFFQKLSFFDKNIVAVGANGSGKTTLSNKLKRYLPKTCVVIAAQKILIIPTFSSISNFNQTSQKLQQSQTVDKSLKTTYDTGSNGNAYSLLTTLGGEFQILLDNLLAERNIFRNKFCDDLRNGGNNIMVPETKLDIALKIWNSLIQHRTLECNDGINFTLKFDTINPYPAHQMSDGEKVALYLIAQVLQAPKDGFIIIDEPEMYLHKTILKKLWDRLEQERQDCIFIYLTHDLDFATSRNAKKVWIKSHIYPDEWKIEDIPENADLPEALLLELLGSRKSILFCEGEKGGKDEVIYNCLFPELTITPVGSCLAVINYTKAFNNIPNKTVKALGLIDADHHDKERLDALKADNIFSLPVAEVENLLLQEDFLKLFAKEREMKDDNETTIIKAIENIKNEVISDLEKNIELQVSNYVSAKVDYYFKDSNVKKGNTQEEVENNYNKFTRKIEIDGWYSQRKMELEKIITDKDYAKVLAVYNNKGLKKIVNDCFGRKDFLGKAVKFLQLDKDAQEIIRQNFPQEIIKENNAAN